ncbi:tau-tubulin kinase 1-like isoform X2 [Eriocheir sinensis]|uniref:tau-tubulin kinase 1-like isoform X2 n=1 Tax=Eriocheir sinensis TaxID=95602 RepID=UPI0021C755CC|nr:tau-tubulin kinase 1-like isoform X2 [Eriocheir sinensis]
MIPDECAAAAMDAARDVDVGLDDAGKSKKTPDDQDINDNHTKPTPPRDETDDPDDAATDTTSMTNGEAATGEESEDKLENSEESDVKEGEDGAAQGDARESKENEERDEDEEEEEEEEEDGVVERVTQVEVMSEEEKDSSEDDEDKLVISEGVEKAPEDSNDDSLKGDPPAPPTITPAPSHPPASPRRSEKRPAEGEVGEGGEGGPDTPSKRPRPLEEMVCLEGLTSLPQVEGSLAQVKRDLEAMEFLIKQKEEEWNTLLRLQKRKEELFVRLARRRQTLLMRQGGEAGEEEAGAVGAEGEEEGRSNLLFLPQGGYSSLGGPQLPLMMMSQLLSSSVSAQALQQMVGPAVIRTREGSPDNTSSANNNNINNNNISIIDIHTSTNKPQDRSKVTLTQEAQNKLTRQLTSAGYTSMKPILPKPSGVGVGGLGGGVGALGAMAGLPTSLSFSATGHGPQGPTVNVQHLIAAHRKENPNTPPIRRATRGAWRNRYDGDKRPPHAHSRDQDRPPSVSSSSSEAESRPTVPPGAPAQGLPVSAASKGSLALSDPSVSYKDVLLRFAELTQIEKQPGSPQISIFPVASSEGGGGKRGDLGGRETAPPTIRAQTPPTHHPSAAPPKAGMEGAPSALAKLLLESRASVSGSGLVKGGGGGGGGGVGGEPSPNSHYLTLSALLSGGSTTTIKDKLSMAQSEARGKKSGSSGGSQAGEEGAGNPKCQGCHKQRAQFVCAGCGNQWYCSRECQVSAWEEHSEHCNN